MRQTLTSFIILTALLLSCNPDPKSLTDNQVNEIKTSIEKIALDNLRYWEPPFYENKLLLAYTQRDDFKFTVDGYYINDFENWKAIVYESMEQDRKNYKHYKHIIKDIYTNVINENSGFVTLNYIWDYITNDDLHYNTHATVTALYRLEENGWKIVNAHVSHGQKRIVEIND